MYGEEVEVKDSPRLKVRRGDLIRIPDSEIFSKVSRNQFAVVLDRYKYNKKLQGSDKIWFRDYGCEVLFVTGSLKGKVRRFYGKIRQEYKYIG
jgi:ribosome-associated protein YbcJ (S4-like RNA binding protein)